MYHGSYETQPEILMNFAQALTLPATMNDEAATANEEGRKVIKAGTPLGADKDFRRNAGVILTPVTDATKVQAIAMHNVDITDGPKAATVIKRGDIAYDNMAEDVQALFTDEIQKALTHIILV
ncbi:hypothetical protein OXT66_05680 [Lentilactobacillus senioris]|uniref:hypothetical protein n=1 Tax=Lentilactobacillus senioris TaxID=931534 RepID=UPI002281FAE2|nr:hypothetical protein [Lentilactobacillus senioris]MCY9807040.1 hypothetical protein [Lentilactobacillus senioris]